MKSLAAATLAAALIAFPASAEGPPKPPDVALQKEKVAPFAALEGVWSGEAWAVGYDGKRHDVLQTERVTPMLGGAIVTIHGAGRAKEAPADAPPGFEAFAVISYDEASSSYKFRSFANGYYGEFPIVPKPEGGFSWSLPQIRYDAVIKDGVWVEKGFRKTPAGEEIQIFEMTVKKSAD